MPCKSLQDIKECMFIYEFVQVKKNKKKKEMHNRIHIIICTFKLSKQLYSIYFTEKLTNYNKYHKIIKRNLIIAQASEIYWSNSEVQKHNFFFRTVGDSRISKWCENFFSLSSMFNWLLARPFLLKMVSFFLNSPRRREIFNNLFTSE